ncbi:mannosyl-glycoprotein endo-beta-N-acetylglucosamidase [Granulicella sp. WH15]|uniref:glucosaminidase domain-containing protein n=1 Tax=Granulicella sp. WH15 TaxID=2602070 RepID=UPI0013670B0E|nr:glucosaminidase domain-containing protein [Granulicella sp. WH15]QHN04408.1 mannosyl-glycoprotein endo-beta-N-acetylglucosamidase [Granulicella sp. WH15]
MATPEQMARLRAAVPAAQATQARWHVPASVTLAQWIIESSWGASELAVKANNYFGIKQSHIGAPNTYVEFLTAEYVKGKRVLVHALFARYQSEADSFEAHGALLATAARYRAAMGYAEFPFNFALALQHAGYSTSASYASSLVALMRDYNLTQYDTLPQPPAAETEVA